MSLGAQVHDEPDASNDTPVAAVDGPPTGLAAAGISATALALLTVDELDKLTRVAAGRAVPADAAGIDAVHALMRRAPPRLPLRAFEAELLDTVP
jgi:hypothetical protein